MGSRSLPSCLWDHSQEPTGSERHKVTPGALRNGRKWGRGGGPWSFGASQTPSPSRSLPTKSCALSSTQILMIPTQNSQNSTFWSLEPSPTQRKVQKDVLTSSLLRPTAGLKGKVLTDILGATSSPLPSSRIAFCLRVYFLCCLIKV